MDGKKRKVDLMQNLLESRIAGIGVERPNKEEGCPFLFGLELYI